MRIDRKTFAALLRKRRELRATVTVQPTLKGMKPSAPRKRGPNLKFGRNSLVTGADAGKENA